MSPPPIICCLRAAARTAVLTALLAMPVALPAAAVRPARGRSGRFLTVLAAATAAVQREPAALATHRHLAASPRLQRCLRRRHLRLGQAVRSSLQLQLLLQKLVLLHPQRAQQQQRGRELVAHHQRRQKARLRLWHQQRAHLWRRSRCSLAVHFRFCFGFVPGCEVAEACSWKCSFRCSDNARSFCSPACGPCGRLSRSAAAAGGTDRPSSASAQQAET